MNKFKRTGDLVEFYTKGITPRYVSHSNTIVLNQKCVRNNKIDFSFAQYTDDASNIPEDKLVQLGDILINSTGQGTAGRVAFVSRKPDNVKLVLDSHMLLLRCGSYDASRCLNYSLYSYEKTLQSFLDGSTGQGELDRVRLFNVKTAFPSDPKDQRKIVEVLSSIDEKIELNNRINLELEAVAKTLYEYWFVQFDFPDINGKPYKSSGGNMVYNDVLKREIPKGWAVGKLEEIATLTRGVTYSQTDAAASIGPNLVPVLRATNINNGLIHLKDLVYVPRSLVSEQQKMMTLDMLIVMSSGSKEHVGKAAFYYFKDEMSFGAFCSKISFQKEYIFYAGIFIKSDFFRKYITNICMGTNINNLTSNHISECVLLLPPSDLLTQFNAFAQSALQQITINTEENVSLAELRDWLLPMLMNGQITVK